MKNYTRPITLKHKDGRIVSYPSITAWAKRHHKSKYHVSQILTDGELPKNNRVFYQNWYDPTPLNNPITLVNDQEEHVIITNVGDFLCSHKITSRSLFKLLSGKILWNSGLRLPNTPKPVKKYSRPYMEYTFLTPNGKEMTTTNINRLARQCHINSRNLYKLGDDKVTVRGWQLIGCRKLI